MLSITPVVLMGLKRSLEQVAGSLLGGVCGTAAVLAGLEMGIGLPLAVGASFLIGFGRGYPVAAFSALFVQAVPRGEPIETLRVRLLAVATAAVAAFLVNTLVSAVAYRSIFRRRMRYAEATVSKLLLAAAESGPTAVRAGFPVLADLETQLEIARTELRFRRSESAAAWLAGLERRTGVLRRLLHLVLDLSYLLEEAELPADAAQPWLRWLAAPGAAEPPVPEPLAETTRRIRRLGRALRV